MPPFHAGLLPLAVGAPELSPWLLLASLVCAPSRFSAASVDPAARAVFTVAAIAAMLCAYPLVRLPFALGGIRSRRWSGDSAATTSIRFRRRRRAALRAHAISPLDLARGIARVDVLIRRGIEFARPGGVPLTLDVYRPFCGRSSSGSPAVVRRRVAARIAGRQRDRSRPGSRRRGTSSWRSTTATRHECDSGRRKSRTCARRSAGCSRTRMNTRSIALASALIGRSAGAQLALVAAYQAGMPRRPRRRQLLRTDRSRRRMAAAAASRSARRPHDPRDLSRRHAGQRARAIPRRLAGDICAPRACRRRFSIYGSRDHIVDAAIRHGSCTIGCARSGRHRCCWRFRGRSTRSTRCRTD